MAVVYRIYRKGEPIWNLRCLVLLEQFTTASARFQKQTNYIKLHFSLWSILLVNVSCCYVFKRDGK